MPKSESNNTWKKENFSIEVKYDLIPNVALLCLIFIPHL